MEHEPAPLGRSKPLFAGSSAAGAGAQRSIANALVLHYTISFVSLTNVVLLIFGLQNAEKH